MNRVEPNRNVYVGHRYVPLLVGEWDKSIQYEGLSIVTFKGASYTSKKMTPPGIDIENEEYWVLTGNYDAQVEYYRLETKRVSDDLAQAKIDLNQRIDDTVQYVDTNVEDLTIYVNDEVRKNKEYVYSEVLELTGYVNDEIREIIKSTKKFINVNEYDTIDSAMLDVEKVLNQGNRPQLLFSEKDFFEINHTLSIPANVDVVMESPLFFNGDDTGLIIGSEDVNNNNAMLDLYVRKSNLSDWESENAGIKLINNYSSNINIRGVQGFDIGVEMIGSSSGFAYNEVILNDLVNNKKAVVLTNENNGWINENSFYGGRFWNTSDTHTNKDRYGVIITSKDGGYTNNNNNNFYKPSFELSSNNEIESIPILIEHGSQNNFINCRNESNGRVFAKIENESTENIISTGYGLINIEDNSIYPNTFNLSRRRKNIEEANHLIFSSGSLVNNIEFDDDDNIGFENVFRQRYNNIANYSLGATILNNGVKFSSGVGVGVRINTEKVKKFVVEQVVSGNVGGRIGIKCYDGLGEVIFNRDTPLVRGVLGRTLYPSGANENMYNTSNVNNRTLLTVDDSVQSIDLSIINGEIDGFNIYTFGDSTSVFNPMEKEKIKRIDKVEKFNEELKKSGYSSGGDISIDINPPNAYLLTIFVGGNVSSMSTHLINYYSNAYMHIEDIISGTSVEVSLEVEGESGKINLKNDSSFRYSLIKLS